MENVVAQAVLDIPLSVMNERVSFTHMDSVSQDASNSNLNSIPATSGIYKITCTANKKIYIGSALNLQSRRRHHFSELRQNKHPNRHLQHAWNKYGEQVFIFEILEYVLPISLTAREQYWLNKLKPFGKKGFNIIPEAGSSRGHTCSPETREKLRQANLGKKQSPELIEKRRQAILGKKRSLEFREKMRQAALGNTRNVGRRQSPEAVEKSRQARTGQKRSPETRARMSQVNRGRKISSETREKMRLAHLKKGKPV